MGSRRDDVPTAARGWIENPSYRPQDNPLYQGNPLIEALPPVMSAEEVVRYLRRRPPFDPAHRQLANEIRWDLIDSVKELFFVMPDHVALARTLSTLLRSGLRPRNPLDRDFRGRIDAAVEAVAAGRSFAPKMLQGATGGAVIGDPGVGKTTAMTLLLGLYPQVIEHREYQGRPFRHTQVVYLNVRCAADASEKGMCEAIIQELDAVLGTNYYRSHAANGRATKNMMIRAIARLAGVYHLGLLIIDEIQELHHVRREKTSELLGFFVNLIDELRIPIVLVGGASAQPVLTREIRLARRLGDQEDAPWRRMENGPQWRMFVEELWGYQYLDQLTPLTDKLADTLHEESFGIPDYAVKLFRFAQRRAINVARDEDGAPDRRRERLTPGIIKSVARDSLNLSRARLLRLRTTPPRELLDIEEDFVFTEVDTGLPARGAGTTPPLAPPSAGAPPAAPPPGAVPNAEDLSVAAPAPDAAPVRGRQRAKKPTPPAGTAHGIVADGTATGRSGHDALHAAGLTAPTTEFLTTEEDR
jgi:hypothetical protein